MAESTQQLVIQVDRTIAGTWLYPKPAKGETVGFALCWEPSDGHIIGAVRPFVSGGSFVPISNPDFQHAKDLAAAKKLAAKFFEPKEGE